MIFNATNLNLVIDGSIIAHATDGTLNINVDPADATTKDSAGWAEHIRGTRDFTIDVAALVDYASSAGHDELALAITGRTAITAIFTTGTTGDTKFSGTVNVTSLVVNAPLESPANYTATLTGTGALTQAAEA